MIILFFLLHSYIYVPYGNFRSKHLLPVFYVIFIFYIHASQISLTEFPHGSSWTVVKFRQNISKCVWKFWDPFMQNVSHFLSYSNFRHFVSNAFVTLPQPFGKTSANRICSGSCRCRGALSWNKRWVWHKYMKLVCVIAHGKYYIWKAGERAVTKSRD